MVNLLTGASLLSSLKRDETALSSPRVKVPEQSKAAIRQRARDYENLQRSTLVVGASDWSTVIRAVEETRDHGVLCVHDGHHDPIESLENLKPALRRQIAGWLNASWEGLPLMTRHGPLPSANLSVCWRTPADRLPSLLALPELFGRALPVPLLIARSPGTALTTNVSPEARKAWAELIEHTLCKRLSQASAVVPQSNGAKMVFEKWHAGTRVLCEALPEKQRSHALLLGDLAPRLALGLFLTATETLAEITPEMAATATRLADWLSREHIKVLTTQIFTSPDSCSERDVNQRKHLTAKEATLLAKVRAKGPVRIRQLVRSYDSIKSEEICPLLDALTSGGWILRLENKMYVAAGFGLPGV